MAWTWQCEKADGTAVRATRAADATFPSRGDAESWLGESFGELVDEGVDQVRLLDDGQEVYGPMSLHPDD